MKRETITPDMLEQKEAELDDVERRYLYKHGWSSSCEHPDHCWRWGKSVRWRFGTTSLVKTYYLSQKEALQLQLALQYRDTEIIK